MCIRRVFKLNSYLTLIVLLALPLQLFGNWQQLPGPYGCRISDMKSDGTQAAVLYSAVNGGGIFKSVDSGLSWQDLTAEIPDLFDTHCITVRPENPNIIYAGTWTHGIFKSIDGGLTWQKISDNEQFHTGWDILIHPSDANILYAATEDGIYKSLDAGGTWVRRSSGITYNFTYCIEMDPLNNDVLYCGTIWGDTNYIYKSTNGGATWFTCDLELDQFATVNSIVVDQFDNNRIFTATNIGVFFSEDGGQNWSLMDSGLVNPYVLDIAVDPVEMGKLYAATWGGFFMTDITTKVWTSISPDFHTPFTKSIAVIVNDTDKIIYVSVWGGIYHTHDGGISWEFENNGLPQEAEIAQRGVLIDPYASSVIYAFTYGGGTFKSYDNGTTWEAKNVGLDLPYENPAEDPLRSSDTIFVGTDGDGIYKSVNAAGSWFQSHNGISVPIVLNITVDPYIHEIAYVGTGSGAYKSVNGGEYWFPITQGLTCYNVKDFTIDFNNNNILYTATDGGGPFKSYDAGESWSPINTGLTSLRAFRIAIDPKSSNLLYLGTVDSGVFKSSDSGLTWQAINSGLDLSGQGSWDNAISNIVIDPLETNRIFAAVRYGGVYKSENAGLNWELWTDGLNSEKINALTLDQKNPSIIYAGTGAGLYRRIVDYECLSGDVDFDGLINIFDITKLIRHLYDYGPLPEPVKTCTGDVNCDCMLNVLDVTYLISFLYQEGDPPCGSTTWTTNCGQVE